MTTEDAGTSDGTGTVVDLAAVRKPKENEKVLERKWGRAVLKPGFTVVPSVILRAQARLHIDATELAVLLHLIDHWWQPDGMPWPAKKVIAGRLGVSLKTVQRAIVRLEEEGLLRRQPRFRQHGGRTSNLYDLSPLVAKLEPIVEEMEQADVEADKLKRTATRPGLRRRSATRPAA